MWHGPKTCGGVTKNTKDADNIGSRMKSKHVWDARFVAHLMGAL